MIDKNYQLGVRPISKEMWEGFLTQYGRKLENSFVKSLMNIYDSFSGCYSWSEDNNELIRIPFDGRKPSDFLANLVLPFDWNDFEECIPEQRAHVEMTVNGDPTRGVIFKDRKGKYFLEGFRLSEEEYSDEEVI